MQPKAYFLILHIAADFFKEQTGENFSNYLLKVRMEHAVKLLKENKKINDISKECGYQSPRDISHGYLKITIIVRQANIYITHN